MKSIVKSRNLGIIMIVLGSVICIYTLTILIIYRGITLNVRSIISHVIWISSALYYIIAGIANISKPCLQKPTKIISVIMIVLTSISILENLAPWVMDFIQIGVNVFRYSQGNIVLSVIAVYGVSRLLLLYHILRQLITLSEKRKAANYQNGVMLSSDFHYLTDDNTKNETEPFSYLQ